MKKTYQQPALTVYMLMSTHPLTGSPAQSVGMSTESVTEDEVIYSREHRDSDWDED